MPLSFKIQKKNLIKIPKTVSVIYCKKKQLLIFNGPLKIKSIKIPNKILFLPNINSIVVSHCLFNKNLNIKLKDVKKLQGTMIAKLKYSIIEVCYNLYSKLNFIGVGYRAFYIEHLKNQFYFKLGYSHLIYFKIPKELNTFCIKYTKLFVYGNTSYDMLTQTISKIRNCKVPEPYKGKGILYYGEKINLKKGKKI